MVQNKKSKYTLNILVSNIVSVIVGTSYPTELFDAIKTG